MRSIRSPHRRSQDGLRHNTRSTLIFYCLERGLPFFECRKFTRMMSIIFPCDVPSANDIHPPDKQGSQSVHTYLFHPLRIAGVPSVRDDNVVSDASVGHVSCIPPIFLLPAGLLRDQVHHRGALVEHKLRVRPSTDAVGWMPPDMRRSSRKSLSRKVHSSHQRRTIMFDVTTDLSGLYGPRGSGQSLYLVRLASLGTNHSKQERVVHEVQHVSRCPCRSPRFRCRLPSCTQS